MSEKLFEVFGITFTATDIYGMMSVVVLLLFMVWWLLNRKKRTGKPVFAGQVMNGFGFGLLPALAFLKTFQDISYGKGAAVIEPLPQVRWLCQEGYYRPMRIEAAAALFLFFLMCLWLILRREEFPDNGDLLMIAVCLWSVVRLGTEDFRLEPHILFHYTSSVTVLFCLIVWTVRRARICRMPLRTVADITAVTACLVLNILTTRGVLSAGSSIADFAVKIGSALLAMILTLIAGGDVRKMKQKEGQPG
ncbi:MAG: hypothetical protein IKZ98_07395 [Clostridia bacterium]|nr:hypothetical protein [Clostridia bacterium]